MENIWGILGISKTKDVNVLKNAYREKLVSVNPEDDPEGFKVLRSAYEEAVKRANTEEPLAKISSPFDQWMEQVEDTYKNFSRRNSLSCWKEVFDHELCVGLDTIDQARNKLLEFLMSHFRLSYPIWELIEQRFHLSEDKKELYEHYPKNFIDFVFNNISYPGFLEYELFEGADQGDYDAFIDEFFRLRNTIAEGKESPIPLIEKLKDMDVYHPYLDVEYVRFQIKEQNWKEAKTVIEELVKKYPNDLYILLYQAKTNWGLKEYEQAYESYLKILDKNPNYYAAKTGVADYYQKTGKYWEAKELYTELLDYDSQNPYLLEQMREVNEILIEEFRQKLEVSPEDISTSVELGWCLFQNERYKEVIQLLDQFRPDEENYFHYHNLKGRTYLVLGEYHKSLEHLKKWLAEIQKLKEDGTVKTRKRIRRLGYAYYTLSNAYSNIPDEAGENNEKAIAYLKKAIEAETVLGNRIMYLQTEARLFLQMREYRKGVDICDELLTIDVNYYPAYVIRQEAYYNLEYYKNVIDDYYHATEIYPHHIAPYMWAVKTYWLYQNCNLGLKVIERAEEFQLLSNEMTLFKVRFLRSQAKTKEEIKNALEICQKLKEQVEDKNNDLQEKAEIFYEAGICFMELGQYEEALSETDQGMLAAAAESNSKFFHIRGTIYLKQKEYQKAIDIYQELCTINPDNDVALFQMGKAYWGNGDVNEAIERYEKVIALNPSHRSVNHELMEIFESRWEKTEKISFYEKAVYYATKQLEITPDDYYYIERGLLYLNQDAFKEAEEDFRKAASMNPDNLFAYNNIGMVYKKQEQYKTAIEWFQKAADRLDFEPSTLPLTNMGNCYECIGQYEEAAKCYKRNIELFPQKAAVFVNLAAMYRAMGKYEEALPYYQKGMESPDANELYFLLRIGEVYQEQGKGKKAVAYYKTALKKGADPKRVYANLGNYYYFVKGNNRKALQYYMFGLQTVTRNIDSYYRDLCFSVGRIYKDLKKKTKAEEYLTKALEAYKTTYGSIEEYLTYKGRQMARCYNIGSIYYYLGDMDKAKEYFLKMESFRKCDQCTYHQCYELLEAKAMLYEAEGDDRKAMEYYTKTREVNINSEFSEMKIRRLKRKKRK